MKKIVLLLSCICFFSLYAKAEDYRLSEDNVDVLFELAEEQNIISTDVFEFLDTPTTASFVARGDCDPLTSFLLCTFLGGLGIHRLYMGTNPAVIVAYILTCGGLGIVALIDWVMLIVGIADDDISQYCNNPRFFMW